MKVQSGAQKHVQFSQIFTKRLVGLQYERKMGQSLIENVINVKIIDSMYNV